MVFWDNRSVMHLATGMPGPPAPPALPHHRSRATCRSDLARFPHSNRLVSRPVPGHSPASPSPHQDHRRPRSHRRRPSARHALRRPRRGPDPHRRAVRRRLPAAQRRAGPEADREARPGSPASTPRSSGSSSPAARPSTTRCCRAASTSRRRRRPAADDLGPHQRQAERARAWPRSATSRTTWSQQPGRQDASPTSPTRTASRCRRSASRCSRAMLQMASAKLWGDKDFARLDKISVALPHPDAAAAIIKGGTEITGALRQPAVPGTGTGRQPGGAHRAQLLRRARRPGVGHGAVRHREVPQARTPKTYKAFIDALNEARIRHVPTPRRPPTSTSGWAARRSTATCC